MSILAGITAPHKLAGIFMLSGYLLIHKKLKAMIPADSPNQKTPIFIGQGDADQVVKPEWSTATRDKLKEWGFDVDHRMYPNLPHSAAPQEIEDLTQYLQARLPEQGEEKAAGSESL